MKTGPGALTLMHHRTPHAPHAPCAVVKAFLHINPHCSHLSSTFGAGAESSVQLVKPIGKKDGSVLKHYIARYNYSLQGVHVPIYRPIDANMTSSY